MPSIAIFPSTFTQEHDIRDSLSSTTGFTVIDDQRIITEAGRRFSVNPQKIEKALYHNTSIFNKFTLERELCIAYVKSVLADKLSQSENIYFGFISLLISEKINHVLRVAFVDKKEIRIERAVHSGLTPGDAEKSIKESDISAFSFTDFIHSEEPWNPRLYDIVIPIGQQKVEEVSRFISEQCAQGTVLEGEDSRQAVADMTMAVKAEIALLQKGHKIDVEFDNGRILLNVNKSVISFANLQKELEDIIAPVIPPCEIEVRKGKDYVTSIYRDQEFALPPKVLLVDDEKDFALTLSERLISRNVGSYPVFDGKEALALVSDDTPDVIVLDLKMPGIDGLEVLRRTKEKDPDIEVIILTGHGNEQDRQNCLELGAFDYLQKPVDIQTLSTAIHEAHKKLLSHDKEQQQR